MLVATAITGRLRSPRTTRVTPCTLMRRKSIGTTLDVAMGSLFVLSQNRVGLTSVGLFYSKAASVAFCFCIQEMMLKNMNKK